MRSRFPRRMAYSPATEALRRMFFAHAEAERRGIRTDDVMAEMEAQAAAARRRRERERERRAQRAERNAEELTRRGFLVGGATVGAAVALSTGGLPVRPAAAATTARIAIVGGGLAGIRCAHSLWTSNKKAAATIYEADTSHIGGRCWSLRDYFSNGLIGEHGGAFINTPQTAIRNLATKLGLKEVVVNGGDLPGNSYSEVYWFNGAYYTYNDANADWTSIGYPVFQAAIKKAPYPQTYNSNTPEGKRLDNLSVPQWLDETGIGATTRFGRLLQADAVSEYGGDPANQSALNLLFLLAWNGRNSVVPLPGDDEKYWLDGGNDQLVSRMLAQLPADTVKQGYQLVAVKDNGNKTYTLSFKTGPTTVDVVADHVVLALPFTTLRDVDLTKANLSPMKTRTITQFDLGTNAKIHVEVSRKTWPGLGFSGATYTDHTGFCTAWDGSVQLGANGAPAILLGFPGGTAGRDVLTGAAHGPAPAKDVSWFLNQIEPIFPGTTAAYTGKAYEDHWSASPYQKGAYSYYKVGQQTTFGGSEKLQEGNIHFAGEHTEYEEQGFLNGAVVSGERAAGEVYAQI